MAHSRSAKKQIRVAARRTLRNKSLRSRYKTLVSKAEKLIEAGDPESASAAVRVAVSALDKTAQRGIIHRNNAARRKSRLVKKLNAMQAQASKA